MTPAVVALSIVGLIIAAVIVLGSFAARGVRMNPDQYIVGGRSFGALLLWLLMAGEIYTTFTFLGAAGWAYGKGAPAFYILCYGPLAYIIAYFLTPPLWRVAKHYGLLTGPDFFAKRYQSKALGAIVAVTGFVFLVPYVTLQLTGLQILLGIAGYGSLGALWAVGIAFILTALFVFTAGMRGLAWASVAKDTLVLAAVVFAGIALPIHFFGSPVRVLNGVVAAHPHWLTLVGGGAPFGTRWFVTTVLLTGCGFFVWPQSMAATFSARSDATLRRNAIALPVYNIMLLLVMFAGFTALLVLPGMQGPAADRAFMQVVARYFPAWLLGFIAAAGCLAALVPASGQLLAASSIVVKNVMGDLLNVATGERERTRATRIMVVVVAVLALWFWASEQHTLVDLLLIAYNGIAQFFPGTVLAFVWRRTTAWGVSAGILTGLLVLAISTAEHLSMAGINAGMVALACNALLCCAISLLSPAPKSEHLDEFERAAMEPAAK